jgi:hypothetical protein
MNLLKLLRPDRKPATAMRQIRTRLTVEALEDRIVPITNGVLDGLEHPNVAARVVIRPPDDLPNLEVPAVACSGTLIHPRVLLTAGHCTKPLEERIAAGLTSLEHHQRVSFSPDAYDPKSWLNISAIVTHPEYRHINSAGAQAGSDIGVLILERPVEGITPAALPPLGFLDALKDAGQLIAGPDGTKFTVVGYGSRLNAPPPQEVPSDGLRRVAQSAFRSLVPEWLFLSQDFAAGLGGTGHGDSGGPTFWVDPATGRQILVSVTSRGDPKLVSGGPSYRVDTATSLDFINSVIAMVEGDDHLMAASTPAHPMNETLATDQVQPLLTEAIVRWEGAGLDTSSMSAIDVKITDLPGATLGLASGRTIYIDSNAAGWGWFVDPTPWDDFEFATPGDPGEQNRMDLLSVLMHEVGHLLGYDHEDDGVMAETLAAGMRLAPSAGSHDDWLAAVDGLFAETWPNKRK